MSCTVYLPEAATGEHAHRGAIVLRFCDPNELSYSMESQILVRAEDGIPSGKGHQYNIPKG